MSILAAQAVIAQDKTSLQVKAFDQDLKPLPDIQIAFNDLAFFKIGNKGTAIVELNQSDLPIKAIRINDERLEAASWNLSRGTIEIIVRPVSYKIMHVAASFSDGTALAQKTIRFNGLKTITVNSDQSGKFDLPVSINETIRSKDQFEIADVVIASMTVNDNSVTLLLERPQPKEPPRVATTRTVKPAVDVARLDSIRSLAEFYAMFRDISINSLDEDIRLLVDEKFKQLVALRQDSIRAIQAQYIRGISDTSLVVEDIRNLLKQATAERNTLRTNREEFENKIVVISSKLQRGVSNLSDTERSSLRHDIDMLEQLLIENESQFFENHNDYREIINTLREKYLEVEQLQERLTEAERLREAETREFRQRLIGIGGVVAAFGFLIILLITFSTRLRRQAKSLKAANDRVEQANENLEAMVAKRTHLLEETNRELDTFLYRASHDLKTPVQSMIGLSQIIEHIDKEEMVQHVRLVTEKMNRMLNKLVDISEISQESKNIRTINILDTINKVRNKHLVTIEGVTGGRGRGAMIIRNRPIQFEVDCPESIEIQSSQVLIEIILGNLIENAIFFSGLKPSNDVLRVEIRARIKDAKLELSVLDHGVGIPKSDMHRIFSMFWTGNEASKGSGLGLYSVYKCIIALHGTITFESEEGKFTRFVAMIPGVQ
ncbi:MAG TPA: ATP-binding protein [Cyclobacteriaceae bacterium]|nr:ATP-binding protein [Cyclobacteriaceae bacterium]